MKLFAYRDKEGTILTNVWEYAKEISDPLKQEEYKKNNVFYSLNRDVEKRKRMYAKRTPKGFYTFAFFPNEEDDYTRAIEKKYGISGESVEHAFIKETFLSLDYITLKFDSKVVSLFDLSVTDEYRVDINGQTYYIDVCIEFKRSEPSFYYEDWNGKVFIEVLKTHKNTAIKEQNLKVLKHGVFEYNASKIHFSDDSLSNESFMENISRKYAGFFREGTYLKLIHNPAKKSESEIEQLATKLKEIESKLMHSQVECGELRGVLASKERQILKQVDEIEQLKKELNADVDTFKKSKYWKKWLKKTTK